MWMKHCLLRFAGDGEKDQYFFIFLANVDAPDPEGQIQCIHHPTIHQNQPVPAAVGVPSNVCTHLILSEFRQSPIGHCTS